MSRKQALQDAIKTAMKSGEKARLNVLRLISAALKQKEVDERIEITDEIFLQILDKMQKQRRESLEQYQKAGREDLAEQEAFELTILQEFLPPALSESEIAELLTQGMTETNATTVKDLGKLMAWLKPKIQGRADPSVISQQAKARLGS